MADKAVLLRNANGTLTFAPPEGTPTGSPTVTIYKPGGTEWVASQAATISGSNLTVALSAANLATRDHNYRARWSYTVSSVAYVKDQLFDVLNHILYATLTEAKLLQAYPDLANKMWSGQSTFANQRSDAWDDYVLAGIRAAGKDPHAIMEPYQLEAAHKLFSLAVIARGFGPSQEWEDFSAARLKDGEAALAAALGAVTWYDEDGDLGAADSEELVPIKSIRLTR